MVEEAVDRAEQPAFEGRMGINAALDPVRVRVDAQMRSVSDEEPSPSI